MSAKCLGCGHAQSNHIKGHGLCLVPSCRMCLIYRDSNHKDFGEHKHCAYNEEQDERS